MFEWPTIRVYILLPRPLCGEKYFHWFNTDVVSNEAETWKIIVSCSHLGFLLNKEVCLSLNPFQRAHACKEVAFEVGFSLAHNGHVCSYDHYILLNQSILTLRSGLGEGYPSMWSVTPLPAHWPHFCSSNTRNVKKIFPRMERKETRKAYQQNWQLGQGNL